MTSRAEGDVPRADESDASKAVMQWERVMEERVVEGRVREEERSRRRRRTLVALDSFQELAVKQRELESEINLGVNHVQSLSETYVIFGDDDDNFLVSLVLLVGSGNFTARSLLHAENSPRPYHAATSGRRRH